MKKPVPAEEGIERRIFSITDLEIRAEGESPVIVGHAAVFNQLADLGYYKEKVAPGAFRSSIGADGGEPDDIYMLWNHNPDHVLGRNKAGTLSLSEDPTGLACRCVPPDTQMGRDLVTSMKRGDISKMSIGFQKLAHQIDQDSEGNVTRTLLKVKLYDVSPVTYPAYSGTDVSARSLEALLEEFRRGPDNQQSGDESWKWELELRLQEVELARL